MFRTSLAAFALIGSLLSAVIPEQANAGSYKVLYTFQGFPDGQNPLASLVNIGGTLYGTTNLGGTGPLPGTVFSLDLTTEAERIVHSFQNSNDGHYPQAAVIGVGRKLYGTTSSGGASGSDGTIFSIDRNSGAETVIYSFPGGTNSTSYNPLASLINITGTLYGTTAGGPAHGSVFSLNAATGVEKTVYSFKGDPDGTTPTASLVSVGNTLFGTTFRGGKSNLGTIFSIDPATGEEKVVYSFKGASDGALAAAGLIDVGGILFGTTANGGTSNYGTVFSFNPTTGAEKVLYSFAGGTDGMEPYASLVKLGRKLYGTTTYGGLKSAGLCMPGCGTVFSINPVSGAETIVYAFQGGADGLRPEAALTTVGGRLYGTTEYGGTGNCDYGCGTVFQLVP